MFEIVKSAIKYYQDEKRIENQKKRLLKSKLDYSYLEYMINEVDDKRVEMKITLNDHTVIEIKPVTKRHENPLFTGD